MEYFGSMVLVSIVAAEALVLQHQAISIPNADSLILHKTSFIIHGYLKSEHPVDLKVTFNKAQLSN